MHHTIFLPSVRRDNGTGHLIRSLSAAASLNIRDPGKAAVYVPAGRRRDTIDTRLIESWYPTVPIVRELPPSVPCVVLDQRRTDAELERALPDRTFVIAVDESGPVRRTAELVVDILRPARGLCNVRAAVDPPRRRRARPPTVVRRVLVSFGGEDPAGLTSIVSSALLALPEAENLDITVVRGASFGRRAFPPPLSQRPAAAQLRETFADYDLVVTSYGLTAFEAQAAGVPVALVAPTAYHARLGRAAGFFRLGVRRVSRKAARAVIARPERALGRASSPRRESLAEVIAAREIHGSNLCPACGAGRNPAVARLSHASFFRCGCSGIVYRVGMERSKVSYGRRYFFEEYKRQYGKSYLDDFNAIKTIGAARIRTIERLSNGESPALLDIGCAYGPFLVAARERGFAPCGVDVSSEAIEHVERKLAIPAVCGDIRTVDLGGAFGRTQFEVVTLWYVIEHFADFGAMLTMVRGMIEPGGILAFSTPNLSGISARARFGRFVHDSPRDHYVILSPSAARRILRGHGFRVLRTRVTGHHPERFPLVGSFGALHRPVRAASRVLRWGDTFEMYARYLGSGL